MAQPTDCLTAAGAPFDYEASSGQYLDLGDYLLCAVPRLWGYAQIFFVAATLIIFMFLVYKTVTNRENSTVLEELAKQWPYVILLAIVAIGGAGTILNILLKFLGFGDVDYWLTGLNNFLKNL